MNTMNQPFELLSVTFVREYPSRSCLKTANSSARTLPTYVKGIFHYFDSIDPFMCPQLLDLPCSCGTFNDPVSSIGSVGSLVFNNLQTMSYCLQIKV